jgi:hypothetical protein
VDRGKGNVLLGVVELEGKVLPLLVVDGNVPDLLASTVEDLEVVLLARGVVDQSADLELDLVVGVVGGLVPDVQVLVGQVQGPRGVLLHAKVKCLNALAALTLRCVFSKLKTCAAETLLLLEDALIRDGDLYGSVVCAVEAAAILRELEDGGPGEVVALDVVGVEDCVGRGSVKVGGGLGNVGGHTAVEDDRTFDV